MAEEDSQLESYQYPSAHLGHLNDYQQNQLNEFKRLVKQESSYEPPRADELAISGHDDETLLLVVCFNMSSASLFTHACK